MMSDVLSRMAPLHRRMRYTDGYEDLFWEALIIESADNVSLMVAHGKIGSPGRSKAIRCSSISAAQAKLDELAAQQRTLGFRDVPDSFPAIETTVALDPIDLMWATWRPRPVLERPKDPAYDPEANLSELLGRPSALDAMSSEPGHSLPLDVLVPAYDVSGMKGVEAILPRIASFQTWKSLSSDQDQLLRRNLLPYLSEDELEEWRRAVRPHVAVRKWPTIPNVVPSAVFRLAALIGCHDEMDELVRSWPDDWYAGHYADRQQEPQRIIFGLATADAVIAQFRRLRLPLRETNHITAWLAHTGDRELALARNCVLAATSKETCQSRLAVMARVVSPAAAPHLLRILEESRAPLAAHEWLQHDIGRTVRGMLPLLSPNHHQFAQATNFLAELMRNGRQDEIISALKDAPEPHSRVLEGLLRNVPAAVDSRDLSLEELPDALREEFETAGKVRQPKVPEWLDLESLPALERQGRHLAPAERQTALLALRRCEPGEPRPLVVALRSFLDAESLDRFAWAVFEGWRNAAVGAKAKWVFEALSLWGGQRSIRGLASVLPRWPLVSDWVIYTGLRTLRRIGTDEALGMLLALSPRKEGQPRNRCQSIAPDEFRGAAGDRGLTLNQLEDRLLPICGLLTDLAYKFDYGPRQFSLTLRPGLIPAIFDERGKLCENLPAPTPRDNPVLVKAAREELKRLKKALPEFAARQNERLHEAFLNQRHWSFSEWQQYIYGYPLLRRLLPPLVWAAWREDGKLLASFRVNEDGELVDACERPANLSGANAVSLAHPARIPEADTQAWAMILADYLVVPPFEQLGFPVRMPTQEDFKRGYIVRERGILPAKFNLSEWLTKRGWWRDPGNVMLNGATPLLSVHHKAFPDLRSLAALSFHPVYGQSTASLMGQPMKFTFKLFFLNGPPRARGSHIFNIVPTPLEQIDAAVLADAMNDLEQLLHVDHLTDEN